MLSSNRTSVRHSNTVNAFIGPQKLTGRYPGRVVPTTCSSYIVPGRQHSETGAAVPIGEFFVHEMHSCSVKRHGQVADDTRGNGVVTRPKIGKARGAREAALLLG